MEASHGAFSGADRCSLGRSVKLKLFEPIQMFHELPLYRPTREPEMSCHGSGKCENPSSCQREAGGSAGALSNRPYRCDMCEKSYTRKSHLTLHRKWHFPPEFRCGRCGYGSCTKSGMDRHKRACVEYQCDICRKTYRKKMYFEAHVRGHREGASKTKKDHTCDYCRFKFYSRYNLKVHVRSVHLMLKPFRCGCGKEYAHNSSLNRHKERCKD